MRARFTLKDMAEAGYIMGLPTIGEVATHMELHYDAYFHIDRGTDELNQFAAMVAGHEDESIFKYLTDEDKRRMDDELEKAMNDAERMEEQREEQTRGEETKGEAQAPIEEGHADDGSRHEGAP